MIRIPSVSISAGASVGAAHDFVRGVRGDCARRLCDEPGDARVYVLGGHAYQDPTPIGKVLEYIGVEGGDIGQFVKEVHFPASSYCWPCPIAADCSCLHVPSDDLDDEGLAMLVREFARLSKLFELTLIGTSITDTGMKGLGSVGQLESLDLTGTKIADEGIAILRGEALAQVEYFGHRCDRSGDRGPGRFGPDRA